jgi:hypothetical protein
MAEAKFCRVENGEAVPHDYGNRYFRQSSDEGERLVIGPSKEQVELLIELACDLPGEPWYVLYVLLKPRGENREPGRYESQPFKTYAELASFLSAFRGYFESDGRHHVWVGSVGKEGLVVYDCHNVIFGYGPLEDLERTLKIRGFREEEFWYPSPHEHAYETENDAEEERLMAEHEWKYFPLEPGDTVE